jgi:ABC-2 type transport system ATP-binding protein
MPSVGGDIAHERRSGRTIRRYAIVDAMTSTAIEVRGLHKAYGNKTAVDGLDLTVNEGEVFALLGPNGAGKTTTVEILEGFRRRDRGEVSVLGTDPAHADAAWRSRVGIVLQGTGAFDELRVEEVVRLFAGYYPSPDDPLAVIERVGLAEKRRSLTHTLSGGQKRRLDVALGVIGRPDLLFLDEPTTGFDPEARREFWELIRDLARAGTTILLTTHYLHEAEELADRVGVIKSGRLVAAATPAELGGRSERAATVSWLGPAGPESAQTDTPTAYVCDLAKRFDGGEVPGLTVRRPSLEDVYLAMIDEPVEMS